MTGTRDELFRLLKEAQAAIVEQLADQPTDYQRWSLPQLSAQIRQVMDELARDAGGEIASASAKAWANGPARARRAARPGGRAHRVAAAADRHAAARGDPRVHGRPHQGHRGSTARTRSSPSSAWW
jgi:ElaB/YqjD/DUF883 family membrane-anchored ribosome-binding protein